MRQTLVTCFFDLPGRDPRSRQNISRYLQHGRYVLGLDLPAIVFADPELAGWIRSASSNAVVVPIELEVLDIYERLRHVEQRVLRNSNERKDTALFQAVSLCKFELMERAMRHAACETDHLMWVDFGITHVARIPAAFPEPSDGVAVLEMRAVDPNELTDRSEFYAWERGCIAGGAIRGSRAVLTELIAAAHDELGLALDTGWRVNDQQVLSHLSASRPELFVPYFGDYPSVLCNWDLIRDGIDTVLANLAHCRDRGMTARTEQISASIARAVEAGVLDPPATG